MDNNSISINLYIKSNLELQRKINITELPLLFVKSFRLVYMNMFERFDEIPTITLQDI